MNRSFLIVIVPAIAVGLGYIFVYSFFLRHHGVRLEPFRFVAAAVVAGVAVFLVHRHQRGKPSGRSR